MDSEILKNELFAFQAPVGLEVCRRDLLSKVNTGRYGWYHFLGSGPILLRVLVRIEKRATLKIEFSRNFDLFPSF